MTDDVFKTVSVVNDFTDDITNREKSKAPTAYAVGDVLSGVREKDTAELLSPDACKRSGVYSVAVTLPVGPLVASTEDGVTTYEPKEITIIGSLTVNSITESDLQKVAEGSVVYINQSLTVSDAKDGDEDATVGVKDGVYIRSGTIAITGAVGDRNIAGMWNSVVWGTWYYINGDKIEEVVNKINTVSSSLSTSKIDVISGTSGNIVTLVGGSAANNIQDSGKSLSTIEGNIAAKANKVDINGGSGNIALFGGTAGVLKDSSMVITTFTQVISCDTGIVIQPPSSIGGASTASTINGGAAGASVSRSEVQGATDHAIDVLYTGAHIRRYSVDDEIEQPAYTDEKEAYSKTLAYGRISADATYFKNFSLTFTKDQGFNGGVVLLGARGENDPKFAIYITNGTVDSSTFEPTGGGCIGSGLVCRMNWDNAMRACYSYFVGPGQTISIVCLSGGIDGIIVYPNPYLG